ncbi:Unknown protein, partial [Striga hermonthica]
FVGGPKCWNTRIFTAAAGRRLFNILFFCLNSVSVMYLFKASSLAFSSKKRKRMLTYQCERDSYSIFPLSLGAVAFCTSLQLIAKPIVVKIY